MGTILNKNKDGYGYQYTDLSEIHRYLEASGLTYRQEIETNEINGKDYIITIINGERFRGCQVVDATLQGIKNPAQEQGSAITYARRYSLLMALGLATDDDDAQSLTTPIEVTQEDADNYTLSFGKFRGKTIKQIAEEKPDYIDWLLNNSKDDYIIKVIELATGKKKISEEESKEMLKLINELNNLLEETETNRDNFYKYYGVKSNGQMTKDQLEDAIEKLKKKEGK